jgi:tRNA nucleotidyltransferase (CCA-adding enzyme)
MPHEPGAASDGESHADLPVPHEVRRLARVLEEAGHSAWAVGGAVRDALAGGRPQDWDLATSAHPREVQRLFRRTVPVGIEHGTVGVMGKDGHLYEVTTFRRDVETFGRKARVAFADTLEEDLERRDFTINAVAWHPTTREVRDPHGGRADLEARVLRTVGDAEQRFAEDRLRVLRGLRFAGRFEMRVEPATWAAIQGSAGRLGHLSAERVREELLKVLELRRPSAALRLYREAGVLAALYPELEACVGLPEGRGAGDVWEHLLATADAVRPHRRTLRLAALLHDIGRPPTDDGSGAPDPRHAPVGGAMAREILRRLKSSNADTDVVSHLVAQHSPLPAADAPDPELRRWVRVVGREHLPDLFRLRFADSRARGGGHAERLRTLWRRSRALLREQVPLAVGDLAISGAELRLLGLPPGPIYGEILRELLERVTEEPALNQRETLIEMVRTGLGGEDPPLSS